MPWEALAFWTTVYMLPFGFAALFIRLTERKEKA